MKKAGRKSNRPSNAELLMKYETLDMSASQIAEEYGVAKSTVDRWVRLARKETEKNGKK